MGELYDRYLQEVEIFYAIQYWVSLDPERRKPCLLHGERLRPMGIDLTTDARAAFMAWITATGRDTVSRLSGFAADMIAVEMGASPHMARGHEGDEPPI
jgi:hypothetical protein